MTNSRIRVLYPINTLSTEDMKRISKLEQEVDKQICSGKTEILISEQDPRITTAVFQTYRANGYQPQEIKRLIPYGTIYRFEKEAQQ